MSDLRNQKVWVLSAWFKGRGSLGTSLWIGWEVSCMPSRAPGG